jgi:hypothetical protein
LLGGEHSNSSVPLRIPTFFNDSTMKNRFHIGFAEHPVLLNMAIGNERIWFAKEAVIAVPSSSAYTALVHRSESLGAPILLVHPRDEMVKVSDLGLAASLDPAKLSAISQLPPAQKIPAHVIRYTPNHLVLSVFCPENGWLLVTDRWASGWHATLNGRPIEVFGGDFIFRAVRVRAGENEIQFQYGQTLYFVLLALSWGTVATVLVMPSLMIVARCRRNSSAT